MTSFKFDFFKGIRPRIADRLLPPPECQTAENIRFGSGTLEPWDDAVFEEALCTGANDIETIYLFRNLGSPEWFQFTDDVDLARGPLLDDPLERTYYTGTAQTEPRMTYTTIATGVGCQPDDYRILGIPAPTVAPTVVGEALPSLQITGTVLATTEAGDGTGLRGGLTGILTNTLKADFSLEEPGREPYHMNSWLFGEDPGYFPGNHTFNFDVFIGHEFRVTAVPAADEMTVESASGGSFMWEGVDRIADNRPGGQNKFADNATSLHDGYFRFYIPNGVRLTTTASHGLQVDDVLRVAGVADTIRFTIGNGVYKAGTIPDLTHPGTGEFFGGQSDSVGIPAAVGTWPATTSPQTVDDFYTSGFGHPFIDVWWDPAGAAATIYFPFEGEFDYVLIERDGEPYNEIVTDIESRVYVYTWVSELGEEGPPSPPSDIVTIPTDGTVTVSGFEAAPTVQRNITNMRVYRANTGTSVSEFQFVAEIPEPSAPYVDTVDDLDLGEVLQSASWDPPPADMEGIIALPNGVLAGFDGKNVCFSEPYFPHAWPPEYVVAVDHDVIGLGVLPQGTLVLTRGTPYMVVGNHPRAFSLRHFEFAQSCSSKKSIINTKDSVIYASPDGLVKIGAGGFQVVTDKHFTKKDWNELLDPTTIDGNWHDGRYFGFHSTGGIIFDPFDDSIGLSTTDETSLASYVDAENDALYIIPKVLADHVVAVADGTGTNCIMSSIDDGDNWVQATVIDKNFTDVAWSPTECIWVAVARDNATGNVFTSTDGLTWTQGSIDGVAFIAEVLIWSNLHKLFVLGGTSTTGGNNDFAYSEDGITWTRVPSSTNTRVENMSFNEDASNPLYIAYDDNLPQSLWTSTNGKSWSDSGINLATTVGVQDLAYSSSLGYWLMVTSTSEIFTTSNGSTLVSAGTPFTGLNRGCAWSPTLSLFVAVGVGATNIATSPTGLTGTWTSRTNPSNMLPEDVEWDDNAGQFIATGTNSVGGEEVIFSTDGITWTEATDADFNKDWYSIQPGQRQTVSQIERWDGDATTQLDMIWKSGQLRGDNPVNLGAARVVADSYPLTFKLLSEGTLKATITVNDDEIFRLPGGFLGDFHEIQIEHNDAIRSVYVAESIEEILDG